MIYDTKQKYIEKEKCYICMEETYSKSPCECQAPICENCFQIEKDIRKKTCSICKEIFIEDNTLNEFLNPFFDPEISPRKYGLPDLEYMAKMKRLKELEQKNELILERRKRCIKNFKKISKNICIKGPIIFIFSIIFGNIIRIFNYKTCCYFEISIISFTHGLLCILFLNLLHDCIYVKCNRLRQPSSFSRVYDIDNQLV
tara:strand:- start:776 stop:1375 length:600 start_codon:yes stop_codon:yes gene_type:complete